MKTIPKVSQYMSRCPYRTEANSTLQDILTYMKREVIRHLPVFKGDELVGVVTRHAVDLAQGLEGAEWMTAEDIMEPKPYAVSAEAPFDEVCLDMATHMYDYAIVKQDGKIVGIFTSHDAIRTLGELLELRRLKTEEAA